MSSTTTDSATWHQSLTTQFTPPAACTPIDTWANAQLTSPLVIQRNIVQSSSCFAPGWTSAPDSFQHGANTWTGAPYCPSGQTVGLSVTDLQGKTTAVCCSSGWGNAGSGINVVFTPTTYSFWSCATSFSSTTTSVGSPVGAVGSTELTGEGNVESTVEYVFVYDQKDLAATSTRSLSRTARQTTTNSPASASAHTTPEVSTQPTSGLSSGAEAGIGVGVAVAVLALIGAGVFYFLRRRKRRSAAGGESGNQIQELDGNRFSRAELQGEAKRPELPGTPGYQDEPAELPAHQGHTELEGD